MQYLYQKDTVLYVDDGEARQRKISEQAGYLALSTDLYIYSSAALSANFTSKTSPILSSDIYLHKQPQIDFGDKVNLCCRTVNNSLQNKQQNEKLTNVTVNKQLQTMKEEDTSVAPTETKNCDLNTTKLEELDGTQTDICQAKLLGITYDGYTVPTLPTRVLLSSQNNSVNMGNFEGHSQNRTGFGFE
jgi:hypothetical protein